MSTSDRELRIETSRIAAEHWWSEIEVDSGSGLEMTVGSLTLFVFRLKGEWHLGHEARDASEEGADGWTVQPLEELPARPPNLARFVAGESGGKVRVVPRVPDRSLVARPSVPLNVLPGERLRIYVSFPVWVEIQVGERGLGLAEIPLKRLSDTWFGSSTLDGELAYALKTQARVRLDEVPRRAYRAITPIEIRNEGGDVLLTDRMSLPVPYLSVYAARNGLLWTEAVTMVRDSSSRQMAALDVGEGPAVEAEGGERLSDPRRAVTPNVFVRAFSNLLEPLSGKDTDG